MARAILYSTWNKLMVIEELYHKMLKWFQNNHPDKMDRFIQSISPNQIQSKTWLLDSLDKVHIPRDTNGQFKIEIIGGWFGFPLIDLLYGKYGDDIRGIDFFEIDEFAVQVCNVYLAFHKHNFSGVRMFNDDYFDFKRTDDREPERAHLIINTSCEHMEPMGDMSQYYLEPKRTLLALQSNDKTDEDDHINCVESPTELCEQAKIHQLYGDNSIMRTVNQFDDVDYWQRFIALGKWNV